MNKEDEIRKKNLNIVRLSPNGVMYVVKGLVRDLCTTIYGMMGTNLITRLTSTPTLIMCLNRLRIILNSFYSSANHIITLLNGLKRLQMINSRDFSRQGE